MRHSKRKRVATKLARRMVRESATFDGEYPFEAVREATHRVVAGTLSLEEFSLAHYWFFSTSIEWPNGNPPSHSPPLQDWLDFDTNGEWFTRNLIGEILVEALGWEKLGYGEVTHE